MKFQALALVLTSFSAFSTSALAGGKVQCSLVSTADAANALVTEVALVDDQYSESESIDIGDDSYSFAVHTVASGSKFDFEVIFYENNHVQDEVGAMGCEYDPSKRGRFCEEPMHDDNGDHVMDFYCEASR